LSRNGKKINGKDGHAAVGGEEQHAVNGACVLGDRMVLDLAALSSRDEREPLTPVDVAGDALKDAGENAGEEGTANGKRLNALVQRDGRLIHRCLLGDVSAWSEIYREFHDSLLVSIRRYLNRAGQDANLVEEIAARVWYALIKNGFELLAKFDVSRGCRLSTYLSVVAKNETRVLFRSERRRRSREQLASKPDITDQSLVETHQLMTDDEFLMTLSQAERAYFLDVLVAAPTERETAEQSYSTENNWQLRHRIRKKLEQYISEVDA
jgi:DNA-directed RNA polymerase specialized sigma24 family protein